MTWTPPRTWAPGEIVTAALLNTYLRDNQKAIGDPWTAYTPTWTGTGFSIGNGSISGAVMLAGKTCLFEIIATIGSTTTVGSGAYSFGLPATVVSVNMSVGTATVFDTSPGAARCRHAYANTATTCALADDSGVFVSGAAPFALAVGDTIKTNGMYQVA